MPYSELESVFIAWGVEYDETAREHEWMSRRAADRAADSWLEKVAALDDNLMWDSQLAYIGALMKGGSKYDAKRAAVAAIRG